jgi:hypothetical protein
VIGGHGYVIAPGRPPNLLTPPGYAYFLAGLYTLFGAEVNEGPRVWVAQSAIDAITCGAIYAIGALLLRNRKAGIAAAAAWAIYPQMAVYAARIAPETLFTLLFVALFAAWLVLEERGGARRAALAGAAWGLLVLTKEKAILLPVVLLARLAWVRRRELRRFAPEAALFVAAALVVIAPWIYRGYLVTGGFVPITLRGGRALAEGMSRDFGGADTFMIDGFETNFREQPGASGPVPALTQEERDASTRALQERESSRLRQMLGKVVHEPGPFLRRTAVRAAAYWYFGQPRVVLGNALINIPLLALGIAGMVMARGTSVASVAALLILYMNAIHAVTVVRMRYSLPVMPFVILFAAVACLRIAAALRARRAARDAGG